MGKVLRKGDAIPPPGDDRHSKLGYSNSGGSQDMGDTSERLARLETSFEHMKKDISDLKMLVVGGVLTILFGVAGVVYWQGSWFQHSLSQSREEWRATLAAQKAEQDRKDAEWKARMDKNEARWDRMLDELHSQDKRISKIESK